MCQGRDEENVKINSHPHTEMDKVCSHNLLKSMFLLKENLVWLRLHCPAPEQSKSNNHEKNVQPSSDPQVPKLDPGFTPLFLQYNDCEISFFLSVPQVPQL